MLCLDVKYSLIDFLRKKYWDNACLSSVGILDLAASFRSSCLAGNPNPTDCVIVPNISRGRQVDDKDKWGFAKDNVVSLTNRESQSWYIFQSQNCWIQNTKHNFLLTIGQIIQIMAPIKNWRKSHCLGKVSLMKTW